MTGDGHGGSDPDAGTPVAEQPFDGSVMTVDGERVQ